MARSIERRFLSWDGSFLPRAADEIARALARDPRPVEIAVLPGRRAARRLEELLAERLDPGRLPPRLVTEGGLAAALAERPLALASRLARELAWAGALGDLPPEDVARCLGRAPVHTDLGGWRALARQCLRAADELAREGLDFESVHSLSGERLGEALRDRYGLLAAAAAQADERLSACGLLDPSRAPSSVAERGLARAEGRVWLVALADLDAARKRLLEAFGGDVTALVLAPQDLAEGFDAWGALVPAFWVGRDVPLEERQWRVADGPEQLGGESLDWLREISGSGLDPSSVTLGVLAGELEPFVERALASEGLRTRAAAGTSLEPTAPVLALRSAADLLRGQSSESFAAFVRHPAVEDALRRELGAIAGDLAPAFDAYWLEHLAARAQAPWLAGRSAVQPLQRLAVALHGLLGELASSRRAPLSTWAGEAGAFLARLWPQSRRDPGHSDAWALHAALEACAACLQEARELAAGPLDPADLGAADALSLLCARFEGERVALAPDPEALETAGWLELVLDEAPFVLLAGFDEGCVPAPESGDAFLPEAARGALGLASGERRLARDVWAASAILAARTGRSDAGVLAVSLRTSRDGDPRRPSRLVFYCPREKAVERVRRFFHSADDAPRTLPLPEKAPGKRDLPMAAPRGVRSLSVTAFRDYLESPYRFYLLHVLGLERVDDPQGELDPLAFGILAHDALCAFGRGPFAASPREDEIARQLSAELDQLAGERYGRDPPPAVSLQLEQLRHRFRGFARWQAAQVREGWNIARVEFGPEGFALEVDGEPMAVHGRIDRLDRHAASGAWRVIDYKTGEKGEAPPRPPSEPGAWKDLQLPLYRAMLEGELDGGDVELGYVVVPKQADRVEFKPAQYSAAHLADALETAREVVRDVRAGRFADPGEFERREHDPLLCAIAGVGLLEEEVELDEPEDGEEEAS